MCLAKNIFIFLICLVFFWFCQAQTPFISEPDGYFHAKLAYLFRTQGFIKDFPWTSLSYWKDSFSDKEFLYHLLLSPLTFFSLPTAIKTLTVLLASFTSWSFYRILQIYKVPFPSFGLFILLTSSTYFLFRLNAPRPHVIAVGLSLWIAYTITKRHYKFLFTSCAFFSLFYTGIFLPIAFVLLAFFHQWFFEKKKDLKLLSYSIGGLAIGIALNPYFPRNLIMFFITNFYILSKSLSSGITHNLGAELSPMTTRSLFLQIPTLFAGAFGIVVLFLSAPKKLSRVTQEFFLFFSVTLALTMNSMRFIEYSVPFLAMLLFLLCKEFFPSKALSFHSLKNAKATIFAFLILSVTTLTAYRNLSHFIESYKAKSSKFRLASLELRDHATDNEIIFTCDWDDGPELWYYNDRYRYLVFLDPLLMFYSYPEQYLQWRKLQVGAFDSKNLQSILKNDFHSRIGVCGSEFGHFRQKLKDSGAEIIFEDPLVFAFKFPQTP